MDQTVDVFVQIYQQYGEVDSLLFTLVLGLNFGQQNF